MFTRISSTYGEPFSLATLYINQMGPFVASYLLCSAVLGSKVAVASCWQLGPWKRTAVCGILRSTDRPPCPRRELGTIASDRRLGPAAWHSSAHGATVAFGPSLGLQVVVFDPSLWLLLVIKRCCLIDERSSQFDSRHLNSIREFRFSISLTASSHPMFHCVVLPRCSELFLTLYTVRPFAVETACSKSVR